MDVAISERDGQAWVVSTQSYSIWTTTDGGATWPHRFEGDAPFTSLATDSRAIYAAIVPRDRRSGGELVRSDDDGRTWSTLKKSSPGDLYGGVFSSRANPGLLLLGSQKLPTGDGRPDEILRSSDGGVTWTSSAIDGRAEYRGVVAFAEDGNGRMLAALNWPPGLLLSGDGGRTWQAQPEFGARMHDLASDTVLKRMVGLGVGGPVFGTADGGRSPEFLVSGSWSAIAIDPITSHVYLAALFGTGVYIRTPVGSAPRSIGAERVEALTLATDRCGSVLLAGAPDGLYAATIPRIP